MQDSDNDSKDGRQRVPRPFRLHATHAFLTYPRAGGKTTKGELYDHLRLLQPAPVHLCVAEERHAREGTHFHVLLSWDKRTNIKGQSHFDFRGAHPNIQAARTPKRVYKYITKEDPAPKETEHAQAFYLRRVPGASGVGERRRFIDLGRAGRTAEAIEDFIDRHPKDFLLHRLRVEAAIRGLAPPEPDPTTRSLEEFELPGFNWDRSLSLHLWGPSGAGKTDLAKALAGGQYLFVSHLDDLRRGRGEACVIFDDFNCRQWDRETVIHLLDTANDRSFPCRYECGRLQRGTQRIFTSNFADIWPDDEAIRRRLYVYYCTKAIQKPRPQEAAAPAEAKASPVPEHQEREATNAGSAGARRRLLRWLEQQAADQEQSQEEDMINF